MRSTNGSDFFIWNFIWILYTTYTILSSGAQVKFLFQKGINTMLFAPKEKGQGLVEYAIIIALIAIVVIAVFTTLGKKVNNTFNSIGNSLTV